VYISQGVTIEDDVFIGPGVRILNDKYPPRYDEKVWEPPVIRKGAIINGSVTVCAGVEIGERAIIAAGAVVTRSVPAGQLWAGVPAQRLR
jgi:acetyltransferase-like isoleucine patch superfamily enzyme